MTPRPSGRARFAPSASGAAKPSLEGRGEGGPAVSSAPPDGPERGPLGGFGTDVRGGGGSVTASGATARLPPLGTTLTCWGGGVSGAPGFDGPCPGLERNGFSSASFDKSRSRAGVETMVEISGFSLLKTAANFSANSLAD